MSEISLVESMERALCGLYKDQDAIERLLGNAMLDLNQFEFSGDHQSMVNRSLRKAQGLGKLSDVIETALRDHPGHADLTGLRDKFNFEKPIAEQIPSMVKDLGGFRARLRQSRHLTRDQLNEFDATLQNIFARTEVTETQHDGGGADPGQWDELNRALLVCLGQFQYYRELLDASARSPRRHVSGALYTRIPLAEVAAEKMTLIQAKLDLLEALNEVIRACGRPD